MAETLRPSDYMPRLLDEKIGRLLESFGAVEINGPKFCGKTWAALNYAQSSINLDDDDNEALAQADPSLMLIGDHPHLIDEWQLAPKVRDAVRRAVDTGGNKPGMYLLTGSSAPPRGKVSHSGAGRIASIRMRPMSLAESGDSNATVSLRGLFEGKFEPQHVDIHLDSIAEIICKGGWPASQGRDKSQYFRLPMQYLQAVYDFTAPRFDKDPEIARRLMYSLARHDGEAASYISLATDMSGGEKPYDDTIMKDYLNFFKRIYLVEDVPGWDAPVRSRARTRTRPKRYIADPSLTAATLGVSPDGILEDFQLFGRLFESLCLRDLKVYLSASSLTAYSELRYYRDDYGLEVDAIIELPDKRWAGIEIKLSENKVDKGIESLLRLKRKIVENPLAQNKEPEFLAVITGRSSFARKSPEGVYVIPITCLTA